MLIPFAEKKDDSKKCDALVETRLGKSDGLYCGRMKSVLRTLSGSCYDYGCNTSNELAGNKLIDYEYKLLR